MAASVPPVPRDAPAGSSGGAWPRPLAEARNERHADVIGSTAEVMRRTRRANSLLASSGGGSVGGGKKASLGRRSVWKSLECLEEFLGLKIGGK
jgi:hypothetical protein